MPLNKNFDIKKNIFVNITLALQSILIINNPRILERSKHIVFRYFFSCLGIITDYRFQIKMMK